MTTDQTILYLTVGLTVFFLATVLLFILYSRTKIELGEALEESWNKDYTDQETFLKTQDLSFKYSMSEANVKSLEIKLERLYADRQQLRKDFVEQSEIATAWRQKHDRLAVQAELLHNDFVKMTELLKEANEAAILCEPVKGIDHQLRSSEGDEELGRTLVSHDMLVHFFQDNKFDIPERGPAETNHDNAVLEHIQEIITEQEDGIDWSKPQPFPKDYRIPKGTECVNLTEGVYGSFIVPELTKVATIESSFNPFVKRLDGKHRQNKVSVNYNDFADKCFNGIDLAPINPTDHPLHPEFKGTNP